MVKMATFNFQCHNQPSWFKVQYGAIITQLFFYPKSLQSSPPPPPQRFGSFFVSSRSDLCPASVTAMLLIKQCLRKAIGPSDIVDDFAKYLTISSKSSDILSGHMKNFSWIFNLIYKCDDFFKMSDDLLKITRHIVWWSEKKKYFKNTVKSYYAGQCYKDTWLYVVSFVS